MKLAGHVEDRLAERSKLHPDVLAEARSRLKKLPQGSENTYHWTLRNEDDQVQGHLAVRRVGKARAPVLTTFLSPHMTPSGPELSSTLGKLSPVQEKSASGGEKITFAGLRVRIDRPKGFVQEGKDDEGKPWRRVYKVPYGFLPKTEGGDGEDLDVFLGPNEQSKTAYLIHQKKGDGTFDEFKLMLGFDDAASAKSCYLDHVPAKFFSKMEPVSLHLVKALLGYPLDTMKIAMEAFGEKLGAARWVKKLREGGDLAEEIAQRMGVSPGNRQILEEAGGVLTPHGLPRPGLGQKGVNVEDALPVFRDPTTPRDLILDLEDPRAELPPRRKPKTIGEQLTKTTPENYVAYKDQPGLTEADALAINTNPSLLKLQDYAGFTTSGRPKGTTRDLLQLGSNPGLEVETLMDPAAAEGIRAGLLHRTHQERALSRSEEGPSRLRQLIERRKDRLQEPAPRPPPVPLTEELGAIDVGAVDRYSIDKNQEAIDAQLRRNFHKSPWYDSQGENPAQLGLPGVTPRAEDVGREGKHLRFKREMDQLRAKGGRPPALNSNRSLFWEDEGGYNYTPSQVLFQRPPAPTLLDAKGNPHALAHQVPPPKPATPAKAPEETPTLAEVSGSGPSLASEAPNPVPARGGPTLRQLAGAGGGLLGLAALGRHFHKKRKAAKAQEEASES